MAFRKHTPAGIGRGREPLTTPTVSVFKTGQTSFNIPRSILRDAGLPDFPGARFDVLVGEGEDAGRIAIQKGAAVKAGKVGNSDTPTSITIRVSQLGKSPLPAEVVAGVAAADGSLVLTLPASFPWTAPATASAPALASTNGQALAA